MNDNIPNIDSTIVYNIGLYLFSMEKIDYKF